MLPAFLPSLGGDSLAVLLRTLQVSGLSVGIALAIGIPIGAALGRSDSRGASLGLAVARIATALPPVAIGLVVYLLLTRRGPLGDLEWLFTWKGMVLAQVVLILPFPIAVIGQGMRAIPRSFERELVALGASPHQLRRLLLRELRPSLMLAASVALGRSLSEVGAILIVGGNVRGSTRVLTTTIVQETAQGNFDTALGHALVLMLLATCCQLPLLFLDSGARHERE
ncbi:MAG TPA: tungstate transporter permease [Planctomycetaceae bacterium]|nr:tungstate transporter permease [Planctomycetaceae bacterium]HRF00072.1 ABC transporter permease [Pirellulaceae bacterium]